MKIAFFEVKPEEQRFYEEKLSEYDLVFFDKPLDNETLTSICDFDIISVFIYSNINSSILEKLPNLKLIATRSTGFDHIDVNACKSRNILVCNVPTYGTETVAEHAIALMLALAKRLPESMERTKQGIFASEGLSGFELAGKTLGIIGAGRIGRRVAELAKAFGMRILAYDVYRNEEEAKRIGFSYVDLDTLLRQSDIISLHANLTKDNYHMLDEEAFSKMKDGVVIINTARGALIDTMALVKALESGKVSYAGLDVLEEEGDIKEELEVLYKKEADINELRVLLADNILLRMQNEGRVIITPHNAFNSVEALRRIWQTTVDNIKMFLAGTPQNIVNP